MVQERQEVRNELEKHTADKALEIRRIRDKFNHDLVMHKVKLQEAQNFNEALEHRLAQGDERYKKIDLEFQDYKRKTNNSSETQLHGQVAQMAKERLILEREKDSILHAKDQYKEQLIKALRELQDLKKVREKERVERLERDQQELDAMRMQYMAQEHGRNLHADRKELDGIKRELSGLAFQPMPVMQQPGHQALQYGGGHQMQRNSQSFAAGGLVDQIDHATQFAPGRQGALMPPNASYMGGATAASLTAETLAATPAVSFPASEHDAELSRLVQERDDLLRSGIYRKEDLIVQQLTSRIEQLAQGRDAAKWL